MFDRNLKIIWKTFSIDRQGKFNLIFQIGIQAKELDMDTIVPNSSSMDPDLGVEDPSMGTWSQALARASILGT